MVKTAENFGPEILANLNPEKFAYSEVCKQAANFDCEIGIQQPDACTWAELINPRLSKKMYNGGKNFY